MSEPNPMPRWRRALRVGTRPSKSRAACPSPDALGALIADPDGGSDSLIEHLSCCSACSDEVRAVLGCEELEALIDELAPPPRRVGRWFPALAAGVLVAALAVVLLQVPEPEDVMRAPAAQGIWPAAGAELAVPPPRFEWPTAGAPISARVVLFDALARPVWTSETAVAGEVELPAVVRGELDPGRYFWQVRDAAGESVVLGPFEFELLDVPPR